MNLKGATVLDYTDGKPASQFGEDVIKLLREPGKERLLVVLDTAYGLPNGTPVVVRDHLNLSGVNPLVGPNNPIGERFTVVNDIYVHDAAAFSSLKAVVAAGVKPGRTVDAGDLDFIRSLGAECYTFNLVPTMLIAAHAGWKVLAIVGPEGKSWQKDCLDKIAASN